ncbi:hypothetical protein F5B21DRAFT_474584 [Xylaria acuta]|nr:hypothetical protein F5B21DRAFT_474584 [Xylaria acuta]
MIKTSHRYPTMNRTIYLTLYNIPLFPAHWAIWTPSRENPTIGKRIHVEGDAATSFQLFLRPQLRQDAEFAQTRHHRPC